MSMIISLACKWVQSHPLFFFLCFSSILGVRSAQVAWHLGGCLGGQLSFFVLCLCAYDHIYFPLTCSLWRSFCLRLHVVFRISGLVDLCYISCSFFVLFFFPDFSQNLLLHISNALSLVWIFCCSFFVLFFSPDFNQDLLLHTSNTFSLYFYLLLKRIIHNYYAKTKLIKYYLIGEQLWET